MLYAFACAYAAAGFLFWDIFVARSGDPSCPLVRCEFAGGISRAEDAAFIATKGSVIALWIPCLALLTVAQLYLRLKAR